MATLRQAASASAGKSDIRGDLLLAALGSCTSMTLGIYVPQGVRIIDVEQLRPNESSLILGTLGSFA
jgi:hypothetical protein